MDLSYSEESTVARTVEVSAASASARGRRGDAEPLDVFYDIEATARALGEKFARDDLGRAGRVALQLPDDLLGDAPQVVRALNDGIARHAARESGGAAPPPAAQLFVLGDTSYGERCVDEIAAEHCGADVIVHYGGSILVPTSRIPVVYVFGRATLDAPAFVGAFDARFGAADAGTRGVILTAASRFLHTLPAVASALSPALRARCAVAPVPSSGVVNAPLARPTVTQCGNPLPPAFQPDAHVRRRAEEAAEAAAAAPAAPPMPPTTASASASAAATSVAIAGVHVEASKERAAPSAATAAGANAPSRAAPALRAPSPSGGGDDICGVIGGDASTPSDEECSGGGGGGGIFDLIGGDVSTSSEEEEDERAERRRARASSPGRRVAAAAEAAAADAAAAKAAAALHEATEAAAAEERAAATVEDICFIGNANDLQLVQLALEHPAHRIFVYDPAAARPAIVKHDVEGNKLLMRRFYVVEKLKDAEVIGVVMGTLGMAKYASAMRRALSLIAAAKKKSYTLVVGKVRSSFLLCLVLSSFVCSSIFVCLSLRPPLVVGKVNVPKLCNFMEVDAFVLIADGETALALSGAAQSVAPRADGEFVFYVPLHFTRIMLTI